MSKLKKRVKAIFTKPERRLALVMPELRQLRQALQRASEVSESNALTEIVHFFDIVSRWHDRGLDDILSAFEEANTNNRYDRVITNLKTLQQCFTSAGRDKYGWNRTKRGEAVTDNNVFLGNIDGLFTHPVSFWKQQKNEKKGGWGFPGMGGLNAYDVVSAQARVFMSSHAKTMIKIINNLESINIT